jgi:aminoglycoside phosphotransferase
LDATGAELIRIGSNAVYRLARPVVVRIASDASDLDGARRQVEVARWLAAEDFPAMRALDVEQPLVAEGRAVTFWESAADKTEYAPIGDVATLIRRLHDLHAPVGLQLPEKMPLGDQPLSPEEFSGLADVDAAFLVDRAEQVREGYQGLDFVLPAGVIHGDANVGNVILDQARNPVLIDLDSFAVGPRELDLIQTALFYDRLGWHTEDEYRTFVEVYGFDIMSWSGYPVLADVREVAMTLWLARKAAVDEKAAAEASKRIDAMRTGASRRDWLPF